MGKLTKVREVLAKTWWRPGADAQLIRTPTVLQMEAVECGAASLAMVLAYYERYVPLEELRLHCGVTRDGSKASNVLKAARSYGLVAKGFKKEPPDLRSLPLPLIVFWNFNHFVVVEGFRAGKVHLNDPACGRRVVSDDEFDQSFTGVVLTFEKGPEFAPGGQRPSTVDALKRRFVGVENALAYVVLVGLALVIPGLVIPAFSSIFVDKLLVAHMDSWLRPLLIGMIVAALLRATLTWLEASMLLRIRSKISLSSAAKFFWHVLRLPIEFFTQRSGGELSTRVAINDRVAALLSGDLAHAFLDIAKALFFGLLMFSYDGVLSFIAIVIVAGNLALTRMIAERTRETSMKLALDGGRVMAVSMNGLAIMETIKSNGSESGFFEKWAGYQAKYLNSEQQLARVGFVLQVLPPFLFGVNSLLILGIGGVRVIDGHLSIGMLVAFQSLVASFTEPAGRLASLSNKIQEVDGDMKRLDDVMRYPLDPWATKVPLVPADGKQLKPKMEGYVSLDNISFGYNRSQYPLVESFTMHVRPGQRVAIVGPSGCGKSTVSKLVMGLYPPWEGTIFFDGRPREEYARYEYTNSVALVDQDIVLYEGTVRDNLTLWDSSIPEADVIQAAKDAQIHDMILARQGGYDSMIDEGGRNMSGGQRQRIELARALATNPRVLVLDEATSALDANTEKLVDDAIRRRGCTCIIIAHRLSTIRDCDEIIVMSFGHVVERGRHDDLMLIDNGFYQRLMRSA